MKLTRILFKGMGKNQFGRPEGIWITEEQVNELVRRQYDPDRADKPMRMGGKWIIPKNFLGEDLECGKRELRDLMESSTTFDTSDMEGLAEAGYLEEMKKVCPPSWQRFVNKLEMSGKYRLESGNSSEEKLEDNREGKKRLEDLKSKFRLGEG